MESPGKARGGETEIEKRSRVTQPTLKRETEKHRERGRHTHRHLSRNTAGKEREPERTRWQRPRGPNGGRETQKQTNGDVKGESRGRKTDIQIENWERTFQGPRDGGDRDAQRESETKRKREKERHV